MILFWEKDAFSLFSKAHLIDEKTKNDTVLDIFGNNIAAQINSVASVIATNNISEVYTNYPPYCDLTRSINLVLGATYKYNKKITIEVAK